MQSYGGVSRYYQKLAEGLIALKQEVKIYAGLLQNAYLYDLPSNVVSATLIKKYFPRTTKLNLIFNHLINELYSRKWSPDILHETYYSNFPIFNKNVKRVATAHDMIHELYKSQFPTSYKTTRLKRATFNRVDHIISISHSTKNDLINFFEIDDSKISVIHHGVDPLSFRSKKDNKGQKPYLFYVGNRLGYKNFCGLIKAYSSSTRLCKDFDIITFGGGVFSQQEKDLFRSLKLNDSQVKHVAGNDEYLAQLYSNAAAFIYPSKYEGFGLPPLEAMAAGCPVISSNTSSMPEVVNDAGEFFNPNEIDNIQSAILNVVYQPSRQAQLIERGYNNIKNFTWQKCSHKTLNVYKNI